VCSSSDLAWYRLSGDLARAALRPNRALLRGAIANANAHDRSELEAQLAVLASRYRSGRRVRSGRLVRPGELLVDYVVHTTDVAFSVNRALTVPEVRLVAALDVAPSIGGLMRCKQRVCGLHLEATDLDWQHGKGAAVQGPAVSLLAAMSGRPHASGELHGAGAAVLRSR